MSARSAQTLSVAERRLVAAWAADCVEQVLAVYEALVPDDARVRAALEQTRAFAADELSIGDAIRHRGGQAGAAARAAPTPSATAVAYAAEQAAATAHMGAHALGAAGYVGKALVLEASDVGDHALQMAVQRLIAVMGVDARAAIARLPRLGADRSGPLAPGRLSAGLIGQVIEAVQADVAAATT